MNQAQILRKKFEDDLKMLQNDCPHKDSEMMPYMWAPGHFSGKVRVCRNCELILENPFGPEDLYQVTIKTA